jgi:hypothetical protein
MAIKIGVSHANDRKSGGCCGSIETAVTRVTAQKDENKNANFTAFLSLFFVRESFRFVCVAHNLRNTAQKKGISRLK